MNPNGIKSQSPRERYLDNMIITTNKKKQKHKNNSQIKHNEIINKFLSMIYQDIQKRSSKPFDFLTFNELTDLPLILCEKVINTVAPNGVVNENVFIETCRILFFSNSELYLKRIELFCDICDFKKRSLIYKSDLKVLLSHLHMHIIAYSYQNDLIELIDNFFEKKNMFTINSFLHKTMNSNGDLLYIFSLFFDKFSFGNTEQLNLFAKRYYKSKLKFNDYCKRLYDIKHVSDKAIEYGKKIIKAQFDKEAFDEDSDKQLNELDDFEKEISFTLGEFECLRKNVNNNKVTSGAEHAFSTATTSDFKKRSRIIKEMERRCESENKDEYDDDEYNEESRLTKIVGLFVKSRGFYFGNNNNNTLYTRRAVSSKRDYDNPLNEADMYDTMLNSSTNRYNMNKYYDDNNTKFNEIICFKQSKKLKSLLQVKLIHIHSFLFYFKLKNKKKRNTKVSKGTSIIAFQSNFINSSTFDPLFQSSQQVYSLNNSFRMASMVNEQSVSKKKPKYILKRIILTKRLFPAIIKYPNKTHFQLQLSFSMHNTQSILNFYSEEEIALVSFTKTLSQSQHQCGRNLTDIYEIGNEIGNGKFGSVKIATHRITTKQVAIKVVSKIESNTEEGYKSNKWENDIFKFMQNASLGCENINKCYEYFETLNYLYYIIEYSPDGNLKEYLLKLESSSLKLSAENIDDITKQLLNGISFLHTYGIIHRDIKHTNILVEKIKPIGNKKLSRKQQPPIIVKIIDFGLSKAMGYDEYASEPYGSLCFKAPEIIMGVNYDFEIDIWSLGITLYFVMFLKYPIQAQDKSSLKDKIVGENFLESMIQEGLRVAPITAKITFQCLIKDPHKRAIALKLLHEIGS